MELSEKLKKQLEDEAGKRVKRSSQGSASKKEKAMPTDEDRRKVAARLRRTERERTNWEALEELACRYSAHELADLIEPEPERTCRLTPRYDGGEVAAYECSACWSAVPKGAKYCPSCGARVVDDD